MDGFSSNNRRRPDAHFVDGRRPPACSFAGPKRFATTDPGPVSSVTSLRRDVARLEADVRLLAWLVDQLVKICDRGRAQQRRLQTRSGQSVCLFSAGTPVDFQLLVSADLCRVPLIPDFSGPVPAADLAHDATRLFARRQDQRARYGA